MKATEFNFLNSVLQSVKVFGPLKLIMNLLFYDFAVVFLIENPSIILKKNLITISNYQKRLVLALWHLT